MTLSTLVNKKKKIIIYGAVTIFCLIFSLIYARFSHGVSSPFMRYLALWPLITGIIPCIFVKKIPDIADNIHNIGVMSLTSASALKGIFYIAGTTSIFDNILFAFGGITYIAYIITAVLFAHKMKREC